MSTNPPLLDLRLLPTAGVAVLIGEALVDALLLPFRVVLAFLFAASRKRDVATLILKKSLHAAKDAHPPR